MDKALFLSQADKEVKGTRFGRLTEGPVRSTSCSRWAVTNTFSRLISWSADGKDLFLSLHPQGTAKLQIPQGKLVPLSEGLDPVLAPDANREHNPSPRIRTRAEEEVVGNGTLPAWSPDAMKIAYVSSDSAQLRIVQVRDKKDLASIPLPERSEHWNYPTSVSWSPDGNLILVGGEAGGSSSHFEDYWLFDVDQQTRQYAGGGNEARWSPDGSEIVWSTPRSLGPSGRKHGGLKCPANPTGTYNPCQFHYVWVSHLVLVEIPSLKQQILTSGTSYESDPSWCTR
jgi:Tol biopolymer transport system component